jgi:precorrin-3B C17-methyltransferase
VSGSLTVVGLGPGDERFLTQEAENALAAAEALYGYRAYLDRVPARDGQTRHGSDNREEAARARTALHHAAKGANVVVLSGGDPGVFAMAASVCEEIEAGPDEWRRFDVKIVPGITAMLAVAARAGAPLGHDFCAISLSDNLKAWSTIERRLTLAAEADFVIALYNPASRARPHQLGQAFELLKKVKAAATPVLFVRAAGTPEVQVVITTLGTADPSRADMRTLVIIGASTTRQVGRWVYTPRGERGAP